MIIKQIQTEDAPAAIGPYSQAIRAGNIIFNSGQIPLDPVSGKLVPGGIEEQTRQVLANMRAILSSEGCGFSDIVKTTIYLTNLDDFATVNEIYGQCFSGLPPARACVEVSALPKGALIEIEWITVVS